MTSLLLAGKSALITGASSGIGAEAARLFAAEGAQVMLAARSKDALAGLVEQIREAGGAADYVVCDVMREEDCRSAVDAAVERYGRLDVAFNNAGSAGTAGLSMVDVDGAELERMLSVNVMSVWNCMRFELKAMLCAGGGSIVNNGSIASVTGLSLAAAYSAAKHGVVGLSKAAAAEHADRGIRINVLAPGLIDTPLWDPFFSADPAIRAHMAAAAPMGRLGLPAEVAEAAAWLASDRASFVTGAVLLVDGGLTAHSGI
jgi:A-factor type gamma-butyrolactone 1'-reductase (1S-forming)